MNFKIYFMVIMKIKKVETKPEGYDIETTVILTLNVWLRRCMIWIDERTVYTIINLKISLP